MNHSRRHNTLSVLIPDGDTPGAIKLLRCLGPEFNSYILSKQSTPLAKYSRFCCGHFVYNHSEDWLSNIREIILTLRIDIVFPILEKAIELVIQHRSELSDMAAIPHLPSTDAFNIVRNKWTFYDYCLQHNLPVPPSVVIDDQTYDETNIVQLPSPALLKPTTETGGGMGIIIARSDAEQLAALKRVRETKRQYIIQSYIPGDDLCLCGYCRNGEILKYTIQKSLLSRDSDNYFGTQRAMDFVDDARVVEVCTRLTKALNWEGIICIDLRIDNRDQSIMLLEVNPRIGHAVLGSLSAGINLPTLVCLDAKGMQSPDMRYTPTRYYHPKDSWRMLLPGRNHTHDTGRSHTALRYTLNDPLPDLVDLARRLRSRTFRKKSHAVRNEQ
ncbi:MAG: ATP-grasp domain-containing protein [Smithella sp.]|jgi:predicted ATP-grasp superfamily ATP-dependent carboligase